MDYHPAGIWESRKYVVKNLPIVMKRFTLHMGVVLFFFLWVPSCQCFLCSFAVKSIPQLCAKQRTHSWAATAFAKQMSSVLAWIWQLAKLRKEHSARRFSLYLLNLHLCYFLFKKIWGSFMVKYFSVLLIPSPVRPSCVKGWTTVPVGFL